MADVLNRLRAPFNVNSAAQVAGIAALGDTAHVAATRDHNSIWLPWLSDRFRAAGLTVYPSVANFVLVRFAARAGRDRRTADAANAWLLERGLVTREMGAYDLANCLRIGIGLEDDMRALVAALAEFMS